MKQAFRLAMILLVSAGVLMAQPVITPGSVSNAASYANLSLPYAGIAQGSMFVLFGTGLGPSTLIQSSAPPLAKQLGGTSIQVTVGGTALDALMIYTYATQVAAVLPSTTPLGNGSLTLTYNNRKSASVPIRVVKTNFGLFTRSSSGTGPASVQNWTATDVKVNSPIEAAHPGQVLILWGTGLGPVAYDDSITPNVENLDADVHVLVGNKQAAVQYKGRSAQYPGVDQINIQLPNDVPPGCYVPIAVQAAGVVTNVGSIAITSSGTVCSDPHGISSDDLTKAASGQGQTVGWVQMMRVYFNLAISGMGVVAGKVDVGFGDFFQIDAGTAGLFQGVNAFGGVAFGTCFVQGVNMSGFAFVPTRTNRVDVGTALTLRGPGFVKTMPKERSGLYEKNALGVTTVPADIFSQKQAILEPGSYTIDNGAGTATVGALSATLTIPSDQPALTVNWDNITTIDRSKDLTVTWTGGDASQEYMLIGGGVFEPEMDKAQYGMVWSCVQRMDAGQLTVPSWVLSMLPPSPQDALASSLGYFRAPLLSTRKFTGKNGPDIGYFLFATGNLKNVTYQ